MPTAQKKIGQSNPHFIITHDDKREKGKEISEKRKPKTTKTERNDNQISRYKIKQQTRVFPFPS